MGEGWGWDGVLHSVRMMDWGLGPSTPANRLCLCVPTCGLTAPPPPLQLLVLFRPGPPPLPIEKLMTYPALDPWALNSHGKAVKPMATCRGDQSPETHQKGLKGGPSGG